MSKLRDAARGQRCTVMIPEVCNGNPETTVLAHVRLPGTGMGRKPPDWFAVFACSACHDAIDGRRLSPFLMTDCGVYLIPALFRTLEIQFRDGLLLVKNSG